MADEEEEGADAFFARWLYRRYGLVGRRKPVWAWLVECALFGWRPRRKQRSMFLGEAPRTLLGEVTDDTGGCG